MLGIEGLISMGREGLISKGREGLIGKLRVNRQVSEDRQEILTEHIHTGKLNFVKRDGISFLILYVRLTHLSPFLGVGSIELQTQDPSPHHVEPVDIQYVLCPRAHVTKYSACRTNTLSLDYTTHLRKSNSVTLRLRKPSKLRVGEAVKAGT